MSSIYFLHVVGIIKTTKVLTRFSPLCNTRKGGVEGREPQGAGQARWREGLAYQWQRVRLQTQVLLHPLFTTHRSSVSLLLYIYSTCLPLFGAALTKESTTCNSKKQVSKLQKVQNRALVRFATNQEYPTSQTNRNYTSPQSPYRSTCGFLRGLYKFGKPPPTFKSPYTPLTANLPHIQNFHSYFPIGLTQLQNYSNPEPRYY